MLLRHKGTLYQLTVLSQVYIDTKWQWGTTIKALLLRRRVASTTSQCHQLNHCWSMWLSVVIPKNDLEKRQRDAFTFSWQLLLSLQLPRSGQKEVMRLSGSAGGFLFFLDEIFAVSCPKLICLQSPLRLFSPAGPVLALVIVKWYLNPRLSGHYCTDVFFLTCK